MPYYPDGSPYVYDDLWPELVNIGWLDDSHPYRRGGVPAGLVDALLRPAADPVNVTRGVHTCPFCGGFYLTVENPHAASGSTLLGSAEIHVAGAGGGGFAAPTLVIHYILDHGYAPPPPFQRAVLRGADRGGGAPPGRR
ncbi:hypothetical protein ACFVVU_20525 [Kitasatospora sp. NPDC057965]|uniref:DUF7919 family protein n=1 Tax=Kitasatospora sp. NPDC057965 TaxID=3346291 RepID=UPI0036DD69F3